MEWMANRGLHWYNCACHKNTGIDTKQLGIAQASTGNAKEHRIREKKKSELKHASKMLIKC